MNLKPKLCINSNCNQVLYVPAFKLHMCLQCEKCIAKRDLSLTIADHGGWEEFHQKRHNYYMFDYHKNRRLELEAEYRRLYANRGSRQNHYR